MAEASAGFDIRFIEDLDKKGKVDSIYFTPNQIWFSSLFQHYTASLFNEHETGARQYQADLAQLADTNPEVARVTRWGWQRAGYVGKLLQTSPGLMDDFAEKKSKNLSDIAKLVESMVGDSGSRLTTSLFVVHELEEIMRIPPVEAQDIPARYLSHMVAGVSNTGKRVLQLTEGDREESYYGYFGSSPSDDERLKPDALAEDAWEDIQALHQVLHDQTVAAIGAGALVWATRSYGRD